MILPIHAYCLITLWVIGQFIDTEHYNNTATRIGEKIKTFICSSPTAAKILSNHLLKPLNVWIGIWYHLLQGVLSTIPENPSTMVNNPTLITSATRKNTDNLFDMIHKFHLNDNECSDLDEPDKTGPIIIHPAPPSTDL